MKEFPRFAKSFLGTEKEILDFENAKVIILPIPYDATTSYFPGARFGPEAIISASEQIELYDDELDFEPYKMGIFTRAPLEIDVSGPEKMVGRIYETAKEIFSNNKFLVTLGGEHSIAIGVAKAAQERYSDVSILYLDAQADLRDKYQGSKFSHACAARRILEFAPITFVGTRSYSLEEAELIKNNNISLFKARELKDRDPKRLIKEILHSLKSHYLYVSIDLDVFDPSVIPSTGTPEPGGLSWYEVTTLLKEVAKERTVVGFDVCELSPQLGSPHDSFTAAKLVYKFLGYITHSN